MGTCGFIPSLFLFFFLFFFLFIITSFAQQQPQVDNEMHAVDRREPDKALLAMESPSTTPCQLPTRLPTGTSEGGPGCGRRSESCPGGSRVLSPGVPAQPRGHAVTFQTSACSPAPGCSSRGGGKRRAPRLGTLVLSIFRAF